MSVSSARTRKKYCGRWSANGSTSIADRYHAAWQERPTSTRSWCQSINGCGPTLCERRAPHGGWQRLELVDEHLARMRMH